MSRIFTLSLIGLLTTAETLAQDAEPELQPLPGYDIYLLGSDRSGGQLVLNLIGPVVARPGYDNQPHYVHHGYRMLYSSQRDDVQTEIWLWEGDNGEHTQLTHTVASEFSPTMLPDGSGFSSVLIEDDGTTQRLWRYDMDGSNPKVLLPDVKGVGYHTWLDDNTVALFIVGEPLTLHIATLDTGATKQIAENIGRSLHKVPDRESLSFVDKSLGDSWSINEYDLTSGSISTLMDTLEGSEDYLWLDSDTVLMPSGKKLYAMSVDDAHWLLVGDYSEKLPGDITRLAAHPNGKFLAIVVGEE